MFSGKEVLMPLFLQSVELGVPLRLWFQHVSPIFYRECGSSLSSRFVITPRRRYPIQQAQYSLLGALPTVCWNGGHKKAVLSARNSRMVCSPVTVRIAPPDSKLLRSSM